MNRHLIGWASPVLLAALIFGLACPFTSEPAIRYGIAVGLLISLFESFLSAGAMRWALKTRFFYWVWGGGVLFRLLVFAGTAAVVYLFTELHFVWTMVTMVVATTLFLVITSATVLKVD